MTMAANTGCGILSIHFDSKITINKTTKAAIIPEIRVFEPAASLAAVAGYPVFLL